MGVEIWLHRNVRGRVANRETGSRISRLPGFYVCAMLINIQRMLNPFAFIYIVGKALWQKEKAPYLTALDVRISIIFIRVVVKIR